MAFCYKVLPNSQFTEIGLEYILCPEDTCFNFVYLWEHYISGVTSIIDYDMTEVVSLLLTVIIPVGCSKKCYSDLLSMSD